MLRLHDDHLPLSRTAVDHDYLSRDRDDLFDWLWGDPATRVLPYHDDRVPVARDASGTPRLALQPVEAVPAATFRAYLGRNLAEDVPEPVGAPLVWAEVSDATFRDLDFAGVEWLSLREVATDLGARDAGLFTESQALSHWHNGHRYCPRCGTPTIPAQGGWMRRCFACGNEVFPRTDPAVIVAVLDGDDRLLLGSNARRPGMYTVLAGFVEAGESLQVAIVREIEEESGLRVRVEDYLGSQPWPYPQSLMLAFSARVVDGVDPDAALRPDGDEILDLRWMDRATFAREAATFDLPGYPSIARAMIERWYGGPIVDASGKPGA